MKKCRKILNPFDYSKNKEFYITKENNCILSLKSTLNQKCDKNVRK
jgi:hypothetical protein